MLVVVVVNLVLPSRAAQAPGVESRIHYPGYCQQMILVRRGLLARLLLVEQEG